MFNIGLRVLMMGRVTTQAVTAELGPDQRSSRLLKHWLQICEADNLQYFLKPFEYISSCRTGSKYRRNNYSLIIYDSCFRLWEKIGNSHICDQSNLPHNNEVQVRTCVYICIFFIFIFFKIRVWLIVRGALSSGRYGNNYYSSPSTHIT